MPPISLAKGDTKLLLAEFGHLSWTIPQKAYGLATVSHETNGTMRPVEEAYWLSDKWRRKNLSYYPWHGRGHVQLTWERNYKRMAKRLGVLALAKDPDLLLRDAKLSARVCAVGMHEGIFTGKRIGNYISGDKKDYPGARRVVNGNDRATQIAKLAREYEAALLAAEPSPEPETLWADIKRIFRRLLGLA